jgi:hypothetical protein
VRLSGEIGFEWAPDIGSPRELEESGYARGRASYGFRWPAPGGVTLFGSWLLGSTDGLRLESAEPGRSARKDVDREYFDLGATVSIVPVADLALFGTVVWQRDDQDFPYVRSNVPRYVGAPDVRFYLDSELGWRGDARVLAIGATHAVGPRVDLGLGGTLTRLEGEVARGGHTADVLERVNGIDLTIAALDAGIGVRVTERLRVGLDWRSAVYHDGSRIDEPDLNGWQHALTLSGQVDFSR